MEIFSPSPPCAPDFPPGHPTEKKISNNFHTNQLFLQSFQCKITGCIQICQIFSFLKVWVTKKWHFINPSDPYIRVRAFYLFFQKALTFLPCQTRRKKKGENKSWQCVLKTEMTSRKKLKMAVRQKLPSLKPDVYKFEGFKGCQRLPAPKDKHTSAFGLFTNLSLQKRKKGSMSIVLKQIN